MKYILHCEPDYDFYIYSIAFGVYKIKLQDFNRSKRKANVHVNCTVSHKNRCKVKVKLKRYFKALHT